MPKNKFQILKRVFCVFLASFLIFSCASCKKDEESDSNSSIVLEKPDEIEESSVMLVNNGTSPYKIVLPDSPQENEIFAAEELQTIFYQSTGVTLPIIYDSESSGLLTEHYISIGNTSLKSKVDISTESLKDTGYSIVRKENTLIIAGKTAIASLYGVYDFLEKNLSYKYYALDEIYIQSVYNKALLDFNYSYEPPITYTDIAQYSRSISNVGKRLKTDNEPKVLGWPHSFNYTVSPTEYPQFYKVANNTKALCLTDKAMWDIAVQNIINKLLENPETNWYCFAQEDIRGICDCKDCTESNDIYTYTGTYMIAGNYIAKKVREYFEANDASRKINILLLAYFNSEAAPVKLDIVDGEERIVPIAPEVAAESNVYVQVCPIWQNFASSIYSSDNAATYDLLKNWKAIAQDRLWAYIYDGWEVNNNMLFFFDWEYKQDTINALQTLGYQEVIWETSNKRLVSFEKLRLYHTSSLLFDPTRDSNALITDFIQQYYKEAAPYIQEYFDIVNLNFKKVQADMAQENKVLGQYVQIAMNKYLFDDKLWPELMLDHILSLFDKAIESIEASENYDDKQREIMLTRVKQEQIFPRYYQLKIYKNNFIDSVYKDKVEAFNTDVAELGGTVFIS